MEFVKKMVVVDGLKVRERCCTGTCSSLFFFLSIGIIF